MYIKSVVLENIRGFAHLDLDLQRPDGSFSGWTVFAGPNGSGKTTLLEAIARAIYGDALSRKPPSSHMRSGTERCHICIEYSPTPSDDQAPPKDQMNTFQYGFIRGGKLQNEVSPFDHPVTDLDGWFVLGYGPFRRLGGETAEIQTRTLTVAEQRVRTLVNEGAALPESIQWLQTLNYKALENSDESEQARKLQDIALALLNDDLLANQVAVKRVSSKGLHLTSGDQELVLDQFSDGYRSVIALVLDILRHMNEAFPKIDFETSKQGCRVLNEGVIMIDEVDAHLHVSWQKKIGFWFKERFPNIQFLVTSHSPFVCQAADQHGLIRLSGPGDDSPARHLDPSEFYTVVNGSSDEAALTALFGLPFAHSQAAETLRDELAQIEGKMMTDRVSNEELDRREEILKQMPTDGSSEVSRLIRSYEA